MRLCSMHVIIFSCLFTFCIPLEAKGHHKISTQFNKIKKHSPEYKIVHWQILSSSSKPELVNYFRYMDEVLPGLYVGNYQAIWRLPKNVTIASMLSCSDWALPPPTHINWKIIRLKDSRSAPLLKYLDEAYDFIDNSPGPVLVHCIAGHSRSSSFVIAYLMKKFDVPYEAAFRFLRSRHPSCGPNSGFVKQLKEYEKKLQS
jgi:hypothetical protein